MKYIIILVAFAMMSCNSSKNNVSPSTDFSAVSSVIETEKAIYKQNEEIILTMEVTNQGKDKITFLPWGTPLEEVLTGDCLDVTLNGKQMPYKGIMVKRMPPNAKDYIKLKTGEKAAGSVSLNESYNFSEPGKYKIQFKAGIKDLPGSNSVQIVVE